MKNPRLRFQAAIRVFVLSVTTLAATAVSAGDDLGFGGGSSVAVKAQFTAPAADKPGRLFVTATIEPGWHIYSTTQGTAAAATPTTIKVKLPPGAQLLGPFKPTVAPKIEKDPDGHALEVHQGTVTWHAPLALPPGVDAARLKIKGTFSFGACSTTACSPPEDLPFAAALGKGMSVPEEAAATAENNEKPVQPFDLRTLLVQLGFAFLGGLILNLMPCVLPVLGLKILAFVQQAGESRGRVFMLNVWYSIGMISVFLVLAALAAGVGAIVGIGALGWGQQFTNVTFKIVLTALVFVMALSLLGLWEIPIPGFFGSGRASDLQSKEGPFGAFLKGIFTTILATPCSGPFLGSVFGSLLGQPAYAIYGTFGAIGLGMASPYLLIGAVPELIRFLPKPGGWMETFKQIVGFVTMAAVVYLFGLLDAAHVVPTMTFLLGLGFACWWIGRTPLTQPTRRLVAWCGGAAAAAAIGWFAFTVLMWEPLLPWKEFSPAALAQARAEGKTVMVDFTANWCPNCKLNSRTAIEKKAVLKLVQANRVEALLADWTQPSADIQKMLNKLQCNSIPAFAVWPAGAPDDKVIVLRDVLTESQVLEALKQAGPSKKP
jgi:thiol:disulfide interchange protein